MVAAAPNLIHGTITGRIYFEFMKYIFDNNINAAVFSDNTDVYFSVKDHFMPDVSVVCDLEIIRARKKILVDNGFRLPSCLDNRPLEWNEFEPVSCTIDLSLKNAVFFSCSILSRPHFSLPFL